MFRVKASQTSSPRSFFSNKSLICQEVPARFACPTVIKSSKNYAKRRGLDRCKFETLTGQFRFKISNFISPKLRDFCAGPSPSRLTFNEQSVMYIKITSPVTRHWLDPVQSTSPVTRHWFDPVFPSIPVEAVRRDNQIAPFYAISPLVNGTLLRRAAVPNIGI